MLSTMPTVAQRHLDSDHKHALPYWPKSTVPFLTLAVDMCGRCGVGREVTWVDRHECHWCLRERYAIRLTLKFWIFCSKTAVISQYLSSSALRSLLCTSWSKLCKCQSSSFRMSVNRHIPQEISPHLHLPTPTPKLVMVPSYSPQSRLQVLLCVLRNWQKIIKKAIVVFDVLWCKKTYFNTYNTIRLLTATPVNECRLHYLGSRNLLFFF